MSDWIETAKELPNCDGTYWVANNIKIDTAEDREKYQCEPAYYDGIGFILAYYSPKVYRPVQYWRSYEPVEKRYGKVEE